MIDPKIKLEEAVVDYYGERCGEYFEGCWCCEVWKYLDNLVDRRNLIGNKIAHSDLYLENGLGKEVIDAAFKQLPADAHGTIGDGEMERIILAAIKELLR